MKLHRKKILILIFCVILIIQIIYIPHSVKASTYTQTTKTGISNFPASYQAKLNELKSLYPNWTFTAFNTGINWDEFIREETSLHLRNTVIKSSNALWLDSCGQVASGYACASTSILKYYSDPRNFLNVTVVSINVEAIIPLTPASVCEFELYVISKNWNIPDSFKKFLGSE